MRQFHFGFYCFLNFLDRIFILNGFPNPFIVPSRHSFLLESNLPFSLVVFCCPSQHFDIDFLFFFVFDLIFLEMVFSIHA